MKVDGYKNITIATIFAVFLLQTIWLYNSFSVAVNKLTADVNAFFIQCLFKELDGRFANIPPDAQIQGSNNPNPKYDNYEYINNGIFNLCHKDVNFHQLYLQPIITQYFIDNKSEIWLLFLIAHSKR